MLFSNKILYFFLYTSLVYRSDIVLSDPTSSNPSDITGGSGIVGHNAAAPAPQVLTAPAPMAGVAAPITGVQPMAASAPTMAQYVASPSMPGVTQPTHVAGAPMPGSTAAHGLQAVHAPVAQVGSVITGHSTPGVQVAPGAPMAGPAMAAPVQYGVLNPTMVGTPMSSGHGAPSITTPSVTPINTGAPTVGTPIAGAHIGAQVGQVTTGAPIVPGTHAAGQVAPLPSHGAYVPTMAAPLTAPALGATLAGTGTHVAAGGQLAHSTLNPAPVVAGTFADPNPATLGATPITPPGAPLHAQTASVTVPIPHGAGAAGTAPLAGASSVPTGFIQPSGSQGTSAPTLNKISLDINSKVSTTEIKYRRDEDNTTDIWYANDGNIINEIRVGNNKRWPPDGEVKECKKVMFIVDTEGKKTLRVIYPEEDDAYDPDKPPTKTGATADGTGALTVDATAFHGQVTDSTVPSAPVLAAPLSVPTVDPNAELGMGVGQGMPSSVTIPLAPENEQGGTQERLETLLSATDPAQIPSTISPQPQYKEDDSGEKYLEFTVPGDGAASSGPSGFSVEEIHVAPTHGRTIPYHDSDNEAFPHEGDAESPLDVTNYVTRIGRRVGALEDRMDTAEGTIKLLTMTMDYQHQLLGFKRDFGDKKAPFGFDLGSRARFDRFGGEVFRTATSQVSKDLEVTEHPSDVKLLVVDPNDATKYVELGTDKYKVKQEGDEIQYVLGEGVECKLVTYKGKTVWTHRESDPHPIGIVFYPDDDKVVVDFDDAIVMYVMKGELSKEGPDTGEHDASNNYQQSARNATIDISLKGLESDNEDDDVDKASGEKLSDQGGKVPADQGTGEVADGVVAEGTVPSTPREVVKVSESSTPSKEGASAQVLAAEGTSATPLAQGSTDSSGAPVANESSPIVVEDAGSSSAGQPVAETAKSGGNANASTASSPEPRAVPVPASKVAEAAPITGAQPVSVSPGTAPLAQAAPVLPVTTPDANAATPNQAQPTTQTPAVPAAPAGQPVVQTGTVPVASASAAPLAQAVPATPAGQPVAQTSAVKANEASPVPAGQSAPISSASPTPNNASAPDASSTPVATPVSSEAADGAPTV